MINGEKFLKQARLAGIIATIALICAIIIVKYRQEEEMRIINVPVELTDAQYVALESISLCDAQKEAEMIAAAAITNAANKKLGQIAETYADPMPRTESFVNAETADAEARALFDEIQRNKENGGRLTAAGGVFNGPSGKETWYNLPMDGVVDVMRRSGYSAEDYPYWIRDDGCKMLGDFIMCAANLEIRPRGTILDTSLGEAIVCDTGAFAATNATQIDIATNWR